MKPLLALIAAGAIAAHGIAAEPPCCRAPLPAGPPTDKSLYLLDSTWTSDVGKKVKLGVLSGKPQVVAMFFTHCEYACPLLVNHLQTLERALPEALRGKVEFLLVSFDTERDTPEVLRAYRAKHKLATERWTLLHGGGDDVRELAALLGINFAKDGRGQFSHSNILTVLNARGEIAYQHGGLDSGTPAILKVLEGLTETKAPTGS